MYLVQLDSYTDTKEKTNLQTKSQFVGTLMWDILDVATFGAFEKRHHNTTKGPTPPGTNQTETQRD